MARVTVVHAPSLRWSREAAYGVVCHSCNDIVMFDQAKRLNTIYLVCLDTGYATRKTHIFFQHRWPRNIPGAARTTNANGAARSEPSGKRRIARLKAWVSDRLTMLQSSSAGAREVATVTDQTPAENSGDSEQWRHLRAIGLKVSNLELWETEHRSLAPADGDLLAMITTIGNAAVLRSQYDMTILLSARWMLRLMFYTTQVPVTTKHADIRVGQCMFELLPASMNQMLNPRTRVHLECRGI